MATNFHIYFEALQRRATLAPSWSAAARLLLLLMLWLCRTLVLSAPTVPPRKPLGTSNCNSLASKDNWNQQQSSWCGVLPSNIWQTLQILKKSQRKIHFLSETMLFFQASEGPAGRRGACRRPPRTPRASRSEAPRSGGPCVLGASATWREGGVILCNAYKQPTCQAFAAEIFEYLWRRFLQHAMNSDNYLGFPSMLATFCENLSFRRKLTSFDWISKNFAAFSELQTIHRNYAKLFK